MPTRPAPHFLTPPPLFLELLPMRFFIVIPLDAETRDEANDQRDNYAGSNDGSEAIANARPLTAAELQQFAATQIEQTNC